ncbi:hypothetical protein T10_7450 [Trichinella papuae]|uniref:Uncharacterized protein n=1 Tax=Trichinella papuae TaxID=268474 RepID=A0A0V1MII3_9BILA|nr:hypothetical protein T10_7450 [Trichinella papuae]
MQILAKDKSCAEYACFVETVTQFAWLYGHGKKALSETRTNNKAMHNYVALLKKRTVLKKREVVDSRLHFTNLGYFCRAVSKV